SLNTELPYFLISLVRILLAFSLSSSQSFTRIISIYFISPDMQPPRGISYILDSKHHQPTASPHLYLALYCLSDRKLQAVLPGFPMSSARHYESMHPLAAASAGRLLTFLIYCRPMCHFPIKHDLP